MQEHAEEYCLVLLQMLDTYLGSLDGISVVLQAFFLRSMTSSRAFKDGAWVIVLVTIAVEVCVLPGVSVVGSVRSTVSVTVWPLVTVTVAVCRFVVCEVFTSVRNSAVVRWLV
jgi:hypothetical protein